MPLVGTKPYTSSQPPNLPRETISVPQTQSTLLSKLPAEIRAEIWKYAIGNQEIHIISKYKRIGHAVCDAGYWAEYQAERPDLRASSYMFTFGSLPRTKQLADWSMVNLLRTCQLIYTEAIDLLYTTNTFTFRDLRVLSIFKASIASSCWRAIRSINIYAMFYRDEDICAACEAHSILQLEAWNSAVYDLESLPGLRSLRIYIANPFYLDLKYLNGERTDLYAAVREFLQLKGVKVKEGWEVVFPLKGRELATIHERWNIRSMEDEHVQRLEEEFRAEGMDCKVLVGNDEFDMEVVGQ